MNKPRERDVIIANRIFPDIMIFADFTNDAPSLNEKRQEAAQLIAAHVQEAVAQLEADKRELVCTLTSIKSDAKAGVIAVCAENETDPLRIRFFDIIGQASKALNKHKKQDN